MGQKGNAHAGSGGSFVVRVQNTYTLIPLVAAGAGGSSSGRKSNSIVSFSIEIFITKTIFTEI